MNTQQLKTATEIVTSDRYQFLPDVSLIAMVANAAGITFEEAERFVCQIKR